MNLLALNDALICVMIIYNFWVVKFKHKLKETCIDKNLKYDLISCISKRKNMPYFVILYLG